MTDPVEDAARAAAVVLAGEIGQGLPVEVEAALFARDQGQQRVGHYDAVAIATLGVTAAGLIVAVAQFAWGVVVEKRKHTDQPSVESVSREVRIWAREQDVPMPAGSDRITEVVVTEVIRVVRESD
jgi:hypothetical protein